jgi:ectoine hydroxylase-related dioxygenase (phytanoyl-CoA dioxygenase family)
VEGCPTTLEKSTHEFFLEYGYVGPYRALCAKDTYSIEQLLRNEFEMKGFSLLRAGRNRHFDLESVARICRHKSVIFRAQKILGSNVLLWRSQILLQDGRLVLPWHRDMYSNLLDRPGTNISVHISISAATEGNCVSVIPASHRLPTATFGLKAVGDVTGYGNARFVQDEYRPIPERQMILKRGEFFIFHPNLIHRTCFCVSGNSGSRVALALRLTTPEVRVRPEAFSEVSTSCQTVLVLAGQDDHGLNTIDQWPIF